MKSPDNVHEKYYAVNEENLEKRFSFRKRSDKLAYIKQVIMVFGGASLALLFIMKKFKFQKTYKAVAGFEISILACLLNLIFAYGFGFVAVVNDWWFFFPDLFSGIIWRIGKGEMILGDVIFYALATVMGHIMVILTIRMHNPIRNIKTDIWLKIVWFCIAFTIAIFGITFGSQVTKGMVLWLYIPFGLLGLHYYHKYNAFQLWSLTALFMTCEFIWDLVARIQGIWIFPDASTHPGLYMKEIVLFKLFSYPIVWQPEMTQMSLMSGMICLVFYHVARHLLDKDHAEGMENDASAALSVHRPMPMHTEYHTNNTFVTETK